ncbi:hypothetical protein K3G63_16555 [Hymenobacter sp. HSC-4F20]|uniref:hypothetical protein n=1 Tax=Hymenobacter sp. HSC-4F20 TaxID=2864135 RepID=UPI001C72E78E|nr:hypothetical protein [Hymenobacter sp. HSC-4F20]MBX0292062.1 hypothetical protein [Hymenobacter sp. HSC-4F20]
MKHTVQFTTSYSQFYIYDRDSPGATDLSEFWSGSAFDDKLAIEDGILGVSIGTYSYVNVTITLLEQRNEVVSFDACDHAVEAILEIKSGTLQILDCPSSTLEYKMSVSPGVYRVRVGSLGLDSIVDSDEEADDYYTIELWPEPPSPRQVLKRYACNW